MMTSELVTVTFTDTINRKPVQRTYQYTAVTGSGLVFVPSSSAQQRGPTQASGRAGERREP